METADVSKEYSEKVKKMSQEPDRRFEDIEVDRLSINDK